MTDIDLVSGTELTLNITYLSSKTSAPINLTLIENIVWLVTSGSTVVIRKHLVDNSIVIIDPLSGTFRIFIRHGDTAPEINEWGFTVGSTTLDKVYWHELRLVFADGTEDVPKSFRGEYKVYLTKSWGVE